MSRNFMILCWVLLVMGEVCWVLMIMFLFMVSVYEVCGLGIVRSLLFGLGVVILMRYWW